MKDLFSLSGRVVLVTGAGRGIGRACAEAFSEAGARVIAVARTLSDLESLYRTSPDLIEPWTVDVSSSDLLAKIDALPKLDVLVNNAGTNRLQSVLEVDDQTLDDLIETNIRAAFKVSQAAAKVMVRTKTDGSIIHISSQMGHVGGPRRSVYCMTKHAIEGLTKAMALDLAPSGVRVNSIAPTIVETSLTAPFFKDPEYAQQAMAMIPLGRVAQPQDIVFAALYLASQSSAMVTGTSLRIDGGATAQ
ncbi:MAG TPA: SDR family oxidoreductase [Sphingomicrobium sp.]|nr:SDR family oxidoreductase [Sphingomicrobium sp.]